MVLGSIAVGKKDHRGIAVGKKADLVVISGNAQAPYDALLAARPKDVEMTIVGGIVLYGDLEFEGLAPASPGCEHLDVSGLRSSSASPRRARPPRTSSARPMRRSAARSSRASRRTTP
jgi:hypothetical protein